MYALVVVYGHREERFIERSSEAASSSNPLAGDAVAVRGSVSLSFCGGREILKAADQSLARALFFLVRHVVLDAADASMRPASLFSDRDDARRAPARTALTVLSFPIRL